MHGTNVTAGEQRFEVAGLTRVEGEGSLRLVVRDGEVVESQLAIFEAPRYFEQLVVGRTPDEVLDIVARICGICPIAYQMSAVHAFEDLAGDRRSSRPSARCAGCSTAASGSRATPSTSTCSTRPDFLGLRERRRARRPRPGGRRARPRAQEDRQPDRVDPRRPADPPGQRPRRRVLEGPAPRASSRSCGPTSSARSSRRSRPSTGSPTFTRARRSSATSASSRCATRPSTR